MKTLGLLLLAIVLIGCSGNDDTAPRTDVAVSLQDNAITLDTATVPAGKVSFKVTNDGSMVHELEVIDGDGSNLTVSQGVADLGSSTIIDEVEDVVPGATVNLNVNLEPGEYTLICNLPGHYEMGMVTTITVSG